MDDPLTGILGTLDEEPEASIPLAIVDLESHIDPRFGIATAQAVAAGTAIEPEIFTKDSDLDQLLDAHRVFVTGSADMIGEVDWAEEVAVLVANAAQAGVPTLAVCFGHQMMARHYGGEIRSFDAVRKGVQPIMFHGGGPFPPGLVRLIHTHRDYVASPGKLRPVAAGGFGGIAALQHPEFPLWTCQGHPEWNATICDIDDAPEWKGLDRGMLDAAGLEILSRFAAL